MINIKKLLALLVLLSMLLTLFACTPRDGTEPQKQIEATAPDEIGDKTTEDIAASEKNTDEAAVKATKKAGDKATDKATEKATEAKATNVAEPVIKSKIPDDSHVSKYLLPLFKSGVYTMDITMKSGEESYDSNLVVSGKDYDMEVTVDSVTVRMISHDGSTYICMPYDALLKSLQETEDSDKVITLLEAFGLVKGTGVFMEITEDSDSYSTYADSFSALLAGVNEEIEYVSVKNVSRDGETYTRERYKSKDGTIDYFFDDDDLKIIDVKQDGVITTKYFNSITASAADDAFEIPADYADMSALLEFE